MSENLLKLIPQKKIKPYDGMSITAQVWDAAHSYHAKSQQSHNLFFHGAGILVGMDVIASDPPDHLVYILPGVAVDPYGQVIVLPEPVAYDLGDEIEGSLYLLIAHRESSPASDASLSGEALFTKDEFLVTARSTLPESPVIELARFQRGNRKDALSDARDSDAPKQNEIDLRYRTTIRLDQEHLLTAGVIYLGNVKDKFHGAGLSRLSKQIHHNTTYRLVVDDDITFDPSALGYDLLYLVCNGKVRITAAQQKGLQGYLARGGTILVETGDDASQAVFMEMSAQIGLDPQPLKQEHSLLNQPYLFAAPPSGYESHTEVMADDGEDQPGGFILSNTNYGGIWRGLARDRVPTREEIRAAVEFGVNILAYVIERRSLSAGS